MAEKRLSIIFIDRMRLQIAPEAGQIRSMDFSSQTIKEGKVINAGALGNEMDAFVHAQRITPGESIVVLSDSVCFSQKIQPANDEQKEQLTRDFFDAVPCENFIKKEYPQGKEMVLVAVDSDFISPVMSTLGSIGFTVVSMIPLSILGAMSAKRWLDSELVSFIEKNATAIGQYGIDVPKQMFWEREKPPLHPHKQTIPWPLLGVLVFLLIVLVILLLKRP